MNYIVELNFCDAKRKWDTLASFLQGGLKFDALSVSTESVCVQLAAFTVDIHSIGYIRQSI